MTNFITSKGFKVLLVIFLIFMAIKFYNNYRAISRLEKQVSNLHQEIKIARARNTRLKEQLKNVDDPSYIEKIARKELGLVKPGELLLIPIEEE
ncbi:Septum formation initiator [Halothermothrix orenii H 168]|uniref:Septum formation initiator n=2 Tax=Halothermothrix orenii TaxID=31909 RepID=B8D057_HALOH|nr:Septum formation initiator [Halothermothrix orenii H 168]